MKILITGGSGVIGSKLVKYLSRKGIKVHYTFLTHEVAIAEGIPHKLDITDREATNNLVKQTEPELVIHTSALTNVDLCETNRQLAEQINIEGTRNVVDACNLVGSKIIYISTVAVFDGSKKIFNEDDKTNPISYYGSTKLEGEKIVSESSLPFLIIRTDQPYCWVEKWQKKNSVIRVLEKLEAGEVATDVIDWYNNPTFVDNFVEVVAELIKTEKQGVYHVVGSDFVNRYEWSLKVAEIFGKDKSLIKPIKSQELKNVVAKRPNSNLSNAKAQKDTGIKLVGIVEGLKLMRGQTAQLNHV